MQIRLMMKIMDFDLVLCLSNVLVVVRKKATVQGRREESHSKSPSLIRAAEFFRPLSVIKGLQSVRKHETGLKRGLRLQR